MTVTKTDLAGSLYHQCGCSRDKAAALMETLLEIVKSSLVSGESVLISGFGKFCVVDRKRTRNGNAARTGEMEPGARRAVAFRCSQVLRGKINGEKAHGLGFKA
ncbi:MAG: HU family DNA-binding protein [Deltaproteobacteria bacterium]|nr:HU family DNA-binding protein [Deltaproteobacteria bacterium]